MRIQSIVSLTLLAMTACASSPSVTRPAVAPATTTPLLASPPTSVASASSAAPSSLSGIWLGTLHAGTPLRLQLHLDMNSKPAGCSLDSLDQGAIGIPCNDVSLSGSLLTLDVPDVHGSLSGTVSADGNIVSGTWTQGGMGLSLVLSKQAAAIGLPKQAFDPPMPPVEVAKLKSALDADLAAIVANGALAPKAEAGVTIGVVLHGERRIFSYGTAKPDSIFEIGSVSKTFTGLLLAQMVEQKKVRLDEPLRELLPAGTVAQPATGPEITLVDLSAQRSGLPRLPDNMKAADKTNPYADYDEKSLFEYVAKHGVALPPKLEFGYSNLGVGLLGQALAHRAKTTYEELLRKEITGPLGLHDTVISLLPAQQARFIVGHDAKHRATSAWDIPALAGAGAIRSTASDLLTYLSAQLHPDHLPAGARASAEGRTLAAAITASHVVQGEVEKGAHIALNWIRNDESGSYWHNGGTGGYSSFVAFNPEKDFGVVVLSNTSVGPEAFTDALGRHVIERLLGIPAVSLSPAP